MNNLLCSISRTAGAALVWACVMVAQSAPSGSETIGMMYGRAVTLDVPRSTAVAAVAAMEGRRPTDPGDNEKVGRAYRAAQCSELKGQISGALVREQMRRLVVSVSSVELYEAWQRETKGLDIETEAAKQRKLTRGIAEALSMVYDRGQNAAEVFNSVVAPMGYSNASWQRYLVEGESRSVRERLAQREAITAEMIATAMKTGLRNRLERKKLATAIDDEIAMSDSIFRTYLSELRDSQATHENQEAFTMDGGHYKYLQTRREEWWQARYLDANVVINEPVLAQECGVGRLFAEIAGQVR